MSVGPSSLMQGRVFWLPLRDDCYSNGPSLIADGDMEAVGVGVWTGVNGVIITKETVSPANGRQCLRITNGVNAPGAICQNITIGDYYHVTGYCRGNGVTGSPRVTFSQPIPSWEGSISTTWQLFDIHAKAFFNVIYFQTMVYLSGHYTEWDQIQVCLVNGSAADVYGAIGTSSVDTVNSEYSYKPQLTFDSGLSMPNTCTIAFNFRCTDVTATSYTVLGTGSGAADYFSSYVYQSHLHAAAANNLTKTNRSCTLVNNTWYRALVTKVTGDITKIYLDGVDVTDAPVATNSAPAKGYIGHNNGSNSLDGDMSNVGVWNRTLTDAEIQYDYNQNRMR